jgi:amidohydrolase
MGQQAAHLDIVDHWGQAFDEQLAQLAERQIQIRRHLHAHPELSGEEVETTRFIAANLREAGLEPAICKSDSGVETGTFTDVTLGNPAPDSPRIALRCDIDALPLLDAKTVEYRSTRPGVTHACGHDGHTAIVLGAGLAAAGLQRIWREKIKEQNDGESFGLRLRLVFQPAEETSFGAEWLVAQGAMQGVDAILGLHVDPERPAGRAGIRYGVLTANCDDLEIVVEGRGGHAARPHHSVDPIAAASHLVGALYEFLPRRVDSRHPAVLTFGSIHGGTTANVIPDSVALQGTLRTTDAASRDTLKIEIDRICSGAELSTGARIHRRFFCPLAAVVNDPRVTSHLEGAAKAVLGADNIDTIALPSMGGEDFSVYLQHAPGAMLRLGSKPPGQDGHFLHSPKFDLDERVLVLGSRILIRTALSLSLQIRKAN